MKNSSIFAISVDPATTAPSAKRSTVIKRLYIKNYALIDELDVSFNAGLNILTGQTGAGKSIIIGALNAVLGERADTETVREGTDKAVIEAFIGTGPELDPVVSDLLDESGIEQMNDEVILRREIRQAGSRAFINDTPVNISVLRNVGDRLVDLHGQHDHQLLLKEDHHREVIDGLPGVQEQKRAYVRVYKDVRRVRSERDLLRQKEHELNEKMELHRFQLSELKSIDLDEESYAELEAEMKRLDHAEDLDQKAALIGEVGAENDRNVMELLALIGDALDDMTEMESGFSSYSEELKAARISIQELLSYTERYRSQIEFNPARLEELRQKQAEIRRLEKKYSRDLGELFRYRQELEKSVALAENFDLELEKKESELRDVTSKLRECALELHDARIAAGSELGNRISDELTSLGIPNNRFEAHVNWREESGGWIEFDGINIGCHMDGPDNIAFHISTNKGESPRPLARIASGGEVSRVMLAMKSVIAREQHLPVMIFDEIDSGISGAVAEQVGRTMHNLAQQCQIIAITHLAQIAGQADHHFKVEKQEAADRTTTFIRPLDNESHIIEIASLISGADVSDIAVASAREIVEKARRREL